jgi:hypothetical protein
MELHNFDAKSLTATESPLVIPSVPATASGEVYVGFPREKTAPRYIDVEVSIKAPANGSSTSTANEIVVNLPHNQPIQIRTANPDSAHHISNRSFKQPVESITYKLDEEFGVWTYETGDNMANSIIFQTFSSRICFGALRAQAALRAELDN